MKNFLLVVVSAVVGGVIAIGGVRASRTPDSALGRLRAMLHAAPPPAAPPPQVDVEANELARRFGPSRHSQFLEEWIIRDFYHDKRDGTFVDVGAADYADASNTYFLEHDRGWSGIAVDAQDRYRAGWEANRKNSKFFTAFVSDKSNEKARLFLSTASSWVASSQQEFTKGWGSLAGSIEVPTMTLNDLLRAAKVQTFDFLSLDIELAEPLALAGFDIERFKPSLACVEAHPKVRQAILDYFAAHHYTVVGKYLRVDRLNLWFMPAGSAAPEPFTLPPGTLE